MLKLSQLRLAFDALNNYWDFTLNTDNGYESVRSREKILKRHPKHNRIGGHYPTPEFYEALDAYLEIRKCLDELERQKTYHVALHVFKDAPFSFTEPNSDTKDNSGKDQNSELLKGPQ